MAKLPSFQFYPGDWLRDEVSGCSLAAQGLWLRMLMIMHDADRYGYLSKDGLPIPPESIARRCGCTLDQYNALLLELASVGVPRTTNEGIIFNQRMVDDAIKRKNSMKRQREHRGNLSQPCHSSVTALSQLSSVSVSSSVSKQKTTSPATPGVKELVGYFIDELKSKYPEASVNRGQLGRVMKTRLTEIPLDTIKLKIQNWFKSDDGFIIDNINNVGVFDKKFHLLTKPITRAISPKIVSDPWDAHKRFI